MHFCGALIELCASNALHEAGSDWQFDDLDGELAAAAEGMNFGACRTLASQCRDRQGISRATIAALTGEGDIG